MPIHENSLRNLDGGRVASPTAGIDEMPEVIRAIEYARVARNWSMVELCEQAGVGDQLWNRALNRGTNVGYRSLIALAGAVGLRVVAVHPEDPTDLEIVREGQ